MDLITSRPAMALRGLARRMHINYRTINTLLGNQKEHLFEKELLAGARVGDVVWDVGAFYGWYAEKLSAIVGPVGRVFAVEPNRVNRERLEERLADLANVTVLPVALGGSCDSVNLLLRRARSRVVTDPDQPDVDVVRMMTGDAMVDAGEA